LRVFVTLIAPSFCRFVYVHSSRSVPASMSNVTVAPAMTGVTPELAEQSRLRNSQSAGMTSSTTV
jgi:hypothetical protein